MRDVLLVWRKELYELFGVTSSRWAHLLTIAGQVGVFGFLLPFFQAPAWINETPILAFVFLLLPMMLAFNNSAAVFAGEKERGTLESLLATPLSLRALFLGKGLAVLTHVYGMVVLSALLSLVALNLWLVQQDIPAVFFYSGPALFALFGVSLTVAVFATFAGVIVSARTGGVRTAQTLTTLLSVLAIVPLMTGWVTIQFTWTALLPIAMVLVLADAVIAVSAMIFFRKAASISARG